MPDWARWVIAIAVIVILLAVFIVSFILYRRTPPPKGCEDLLPSEEKCKACPVENCHLNIYASKDKKDKENKDASN